MKNIKLVLLLGLIVSCTPNVNNTLPSPNKTNSPISKGDNSTNINITSSPKLTETTTITTITTVSTPNPNSNISLPISSPIITPITSISPTPLDQININSEPQSIQLFSDNKLLVESYIDPLDNKLKTSNRYIYNSLINEKNTFKAEIVYKDKNISSENIVWSVSQNSNVAELNQDGSVKNGNYEGGYKLRASYKKAPNIYTEVEVNVYKAFDYKIENKCDNTFTSISKTRFEAYLSPYERNSSGIIPETYIKDTASLYGKVYDTSNNLLENVSLELKTSSFVSYYDTSRAVYNSYQLKDNYTFKYIPIDSVSISASKEGWTTRTRTGNVKSNAYGECNYFNFDGIYALQDEPEINKVKINGFEVSSSSKDDIFISDKNTPKNSKPSLEQLSSPYIDGIGNDTNLFIGKRDFIIIELSFSEAINLDEIKNIFNVYSQDKVKIDGDFTISSDQKTIVFKTNKPLELNKDRTLTKYLIDFSQPFKDKNNKNALDGKYFRFSDTQMNDFIVFSMSNRF